MTKKENMNKDIREKMFHEMMDRSIFEQVKEYAYKYADKSLDRNVFPTPEAIKGLQIFDSNQG